MRSSVDLPDSLLGDLADIPSLTAVVLFGSVARGVADRRSDIDLLVIFDTEEDKEENNERLLDILKRYKDLPLALTKKTAEEISKDPDFFYKVFQEGYVLYKRPGTDVLPAAVTGEKHEIVYTYELKDLTQVKKTKFNSALFTREKKKYRYPGILERVNGKSLGPGVIKVPANAEEKIDGLMEEHGVNYEKDRIISVQPLEE